MLFREAQHIGLAEIGGEARVVAGAGTTAPEEHARLAIEHVDDRAGPNRLAMIGVGGGFADTEDDLICGFESEGGAEISVGFGFEAREVYAGADEVAAVQWYAALDQRAAEGGG